MQLAVLGSTMGTNKSKSRLPLPDHATVLKTLMVESERGGVLVGLSLIDNYLGELLRKYLVKHGAVSDADWLLDPKPGNRPLSTLAVRTKLARCLALIDDELRTVIDELRTIRNAHAHGVHSFTLSEDEMKSVLDCWEPDALEFVLEMGEQHWEPHNASRPMKHFMGSVAFTVVLLAIKLGEL